MAGTVKLGRYFWEDSFDFRKGADGYLDFPAQTGEEIIYLDPQNGNDANDGLTPSTPKRNLWTVMLSLYPPYVPRCVRIRVKVGTLIKLDPDLVTNIHRFGEYGSSNLSQSGLGETQRLIFEPYGTSFAGYFIVESSTAGGGCLLLQGEVSYVCFRSCYFISDSQVNASTMLTQNYAIQHTIYHDCHFQKGAGGAALQGIDSFQLNTVFWRCTFADAHNTNVGGDSSGVFVGGTHNGLLFHECVWAYNGWDRLNNSQRIDWFGTPTTGTFTISYDAEQTNPIDFDASAATVQAELEALSQIGVGNVTVVKSGSEWIINFIGDLAGSQLSLLTIQNSTNVGVQVVSGKTPRNHNIYNNSGACNVMYRNCISAFGSATGFQLRGNNSTIVNSLALMNPINLTFGHAGPPHSVNIDMTATQALNPNNSADVVLKFTGGNSLYAFSDGMRVYIRGVTVGAGSMKYNTSTGSYDIPITVLDGIWEGDDVEVLEYGTKFKVRARVTSISTTPGLTNDGWGGVSGAQPSVFFEPVAFMSTGLSRYNVVYGGGDINADGGRGWGEAIGRSVSARIERDVCLNGTGTYALGFSMTSDPYVGADPLVQTSSDANFGFEVDGLIVSNWKGTSNNGSAMYILRTANEFEILRNCYFLADASGSHYVADLPLTAGTGGAISSFNNITYWKETANINTGWFKRNSGFITQAVYESERGVGIYTKPSWFDALALKTMLLYLSENGVDTTDMTDEDACKYFTDTALVMGDTEFGGPGYPTIWTSAAFNAWIRSAFATQLGWDVNPDYTTNQRPIAPTYLKSLTESDDFIVDFIPPPGQDLEYVLEFSIDTRSVSRYEEYGSLRKFAYAVGSSDISNHPDSTLAFRGIKRIRIAKASLPSTVRNDLGQTYYGFFSLYARTSFGDVNRSIMLTFKNNKSQGSRTDLQFSNQSTVTFQYGLNSNCTSYKLLRSATRGGPYTQVAMSTTQYVQDQSPIPGDWYYTVRGVSSGYETWYNEITVTVSSDGGATPTKPSIDDLIIIMNNKLGSSGCWRDFNKTYKYWRFLSEHCRIGGFYKPTDLPSAPIPSDYPDINC
jgi:hypothetical protein